MKLIDISTPAFPNTFAKVDDEDFDFLNQWKWRPRKSPSGNHKVFYALRFGPRVPGRRDRREYQSWMHREIIGESRRGVHTDHIDGDGLNNQRSNLRACTSQQNQMNSVAFSFHGTSCFKGVSKKGNKFRARIMLNRKEIYLGVFVEEIEAAAAYNVAAIKYFGEFARLNVITRASCS